jgi:tetratricopeptide (TPR) repeat protein
MPWRGWFSGSDNQSKPSVDMRIPTPADCAKLPLEEGLEHLRACRFDRAIMSLRQAVHREPGRFAAVRGLVTAHVLSGEPRRARQILATFTTDYPMCLEGWRLAAQLEWKLNEPQRAVEILRTGLERLPAAADLRRQLAIFLSAEGRHAEAAALTGEKKNVWVLNAVGGKQDESSSKMDEDWFDQIAQDPMLINAVLTSTEQSTDDPATIQVLTAITAKVAALVQAQPRHADRHLLLARLQAALNDLPAALESVERAVALNANLREAHQFHASLLSRMGEPEQALEKLKAVSKRGTSWPDMLYQIAELEQKLGQPSEARSHLYSAIRLNPRFTRAHELLERCAA